MEFNAALVCVAFLVMMISNYLSQKKWFGETNAELSFAHPTYVTPDGGTFAIWAFIYSFELLLAIVQAVGWSPCMTAPCDTIDMIFARRFLGLDVRERLALAFSANAAWSPFFNSEAYLGALGIMAIYFSLLLSVMLDLNSATATFSFLRIACSTGIAMNASWILAALCISVFWYGGELGWKDAHGVAGSVSAAVLVCVVVCFIACTKALLECEIAWSFVAAWALRGIYRVHTFEDDEYFPPLAMNRGLAACALWSSRVVMASMVVGIIVACFRKHSL